MDFLRSYFFKNELLISWTFRSSTLYSHIHNQNIGETLTQFKKCLSNVLVTGESNFDARNGQEMFNWSEVNS